MRGGSHLLAAFPAAFAFLSCSTTSPVKPDQPEAATPVYSREALYRKGHQFFAGRETDSARVYLLRSLAMDSTYLPPLRDLALLHYDIAMRMGEHDPVRLAEFGRSYDYYRRIEATGTADGETYDRLTELSYMLDRPGEFLSYAQKHWKHNPSDRQAYNLGLAYAMTGDHQNVIRTQKEAIDRFPYSPFLGGFYRLLGNGYLEVDRDQTAERTFNAGVDAVNRLIRGMSDTESDSARMQNISRLQDDKVAMLLALKKLHRRYGNQEQLKAVERQLKDAGR
jgi:tetratricopeptide (TPR) repeat protein